jgi:predicted DNA-binding transcriptional regulator AlpA
MAPKSYQKAPHCADMRRMYSDDDLLTKKQLASALNVSVRTIERWRDQGIGPPAVKLPSGRLRWRWATVRAWLEAQEEGSQGS